MLHLAVAFAVTILPSSATASGPAMFQAVSAEKASGFASLAECEQVLGAPATEQGKVPDAAQSGARGSLFNRNAGNMSRCEMVDGEPLIVVYPKGYEAMRPAR